MAASDDLEFLLLDFPEIFGDLTECGESPSLLVSENEHNEFGFVLGSAATSDLYPSALTENSNTDQETLRITSSFNQETAIVTQNHRFDQEDDYSKYFDTLENSCDMLSCIFSNGEREAEQSGNCVLTSSNEMMTTALQSTDLQHGALNQSYQQSFLTQTNSSLAIVPYVSTMLTGNTQEVENANGPTNVNLIHGRRDDDDQFHPSFSQAEQYYHNDLLLEQLRRIHETAHQMQPPKFSSISTPTSAGALLNNPCRLPFASTPKAKENPEYHIPVISNTLTLQKSNNFSPITRTSYEPDSFANDFQNSSSLNLTPQTREMPWRYQSSMPLSLTSTTPKNMSLVPMPLSLTSGTPKNMALVPTTQTLLTPHRPYCAKEKGKQHATAMPSVNPTPDNHYQNSYQKSMINQSGGLRQRSCYDQFENGGSSSKIRRISSPVQEKIVPDDSSSIIPFGQVEHMRSSPANHRQERIENSMYDPVYASLGLPVDPHLRFF